MFQPNQKKILVVDDDLSLRTALEEALKKNFLTAMASNGAEGLDLFNKNHFDLVITDFSMPQMTGGEMAREILKKRISFPIIFMTGEVETDCLDGEYPIFRKPFEIKEMLNEIDKIFAD